LGKERTEQSFAQSDMLDAEDVASAVLLDCTESSESRIIEIQMRTHVRATGSAGLGRSAASTARSLL
jgi:hypothetical protein